MFEVFKNFIGTINDEQSEPSEARAANGVAHQYDVSNNDVQMQSQYENADHQYLNGQEDLIRQYYNNVSSEEQLRMILQHLGPALQQQQNTADSLVDPQDEISRNENIVKQLKALQNENLENNINYSLQNPQYNNELLTLLLSQYCQMDPQQYVLTHLNFSVAQCNS
jgi:6-pyruvoyl-tetrahydropterin synthase